MIWGILLISLCAVSVQFETAHAQIHDHSHDHGGGHSHDHGGSHSHSIGGSHSHDHSGHFHDGPPADPHLIDKSFPVSLCEQCVGRCVTTNLNNLCVIDSLGGGRGGQIHEGPSHGGFPHVDGHSDHHGHNHGGVDAHPDLLATSYPVSSCSQCRRPNRCIVTAQQVLCSPAGSSQNSGSRCSSRPERGRCRARINRYYYDSRTRTCRRFVFGGCGGNSNNYRRREDCERTCRRRSRPIRLPTSKKSAACRQSVNRGWCDGRKKKKPVTRYYYDAKRGGCYQFKWRGCGGNRNRFSSRKRCQKKCARDVHEAEGHGHDAIGHAHETIGHIHEAGHEAIGHAHGIGHDHRPINHGHEHEGIDREHGHSRLGSGFPSFRGSDRGSFRTIRRKYGGLGRLLGGIAGHLLGGASRSGDRSPSRRYGPSTVVVRRRPSQRSYRRS